MESNKHHSLVKKIYDYVKKLDKIEESLIECDIFEVKGNVTRMPEGSVPDVYYKYNNTLIIGEAKTDSDFERGHSFQQYESYIKYLKKYEEMGYNCIFIISVPWETSISAMRLIKKLIGSNKIKGIIINELGVYREYEKNNIKQ